MTASARSCAVSSGADVTLKQLTHSTGLLFLCLIMAAAPALAMSAKREAQLGAELHEQILAQMPIVENEKLAAYVNDVGQRLVPHSDRPSHTFTFTVIDNGDINAFAIPGGYIYVHRGLLAYLNSEAQLAAVLGHEIAHVTARHPARQQSARNRTNVTAGVLSVLTGSRAVGEATALWGHSFVSGYGREMELEADSLGARFMTSAGYDPQAVIDVISLLKDQERFERQRAREESRQPRTYHGLFSTHPRNDIRLREAIGAASQLEPGQGERNEHAFRIATQGLEWGRDARGRLLRIDYVRATEHTRFAPLAQQLNLGQYGEETLRLVNGYYPRGEPDPGQWIKILR